MKKLTLSLSVAILLSLSIPAFAQSNSFPWPSSGSVGIGTGLNPPYTPQNLLHLHGGDSTLDPEAILRFSEGDSTTGPLFGILGLMRGPFGDQTYTSLSHGADLVLHENSMGDLILTNWDTAVFAHPGGAIRMATTPPAPTLPFPIPSQHDFERVTIMPSGNVGIDVPPDTGLLVGLGNPNDQFELGGASVTLPGKSGPLPGLEFYGGSSLEGQMMQPPAVGTFPTDTRYIAFNSITNHLSTSSTRSTRLQPMGTSSIQFGDLANGYVQLCAFPYDSGLALNDFRNNVTCAITGSNGMSLWYSDTAFTYRHLFDVIIPGSTQYGTFRNSEGLTFIHTPTYIGTDTTNPFPNFTNLSGLYPDMGDDTTWMLVVNGPALVKELFIDDTDWPDYVFDPNYKLKPLDEVENFIKTNRHLPDIPPASKMEKTGVPVGRTEAAITKQLEEAMLYIDQLHDEVKELKAEVEELKNQKEGK